VTNRDNLWAIILAGGDGARLHGLTTTDDGVPVPKQFCSFGTTRSLLRLAIERAKALVPKERIVTVVARDHERWWRPQLAHLASDNILVQPRNIGTASGVLLPVLEIFRRDPRATVAVLPSDHWLEDRKVLLESLDVAVDVAWGEDNRIALLGMTPDSDDTGYGWIVPASREWPGRRVASFIEKPSQPVAHALRSFGALWSTFMFVSRMSAVLRLYEHALPALLRLFLGALSRPDPKPLGALYDMVPTLDFSRHLLERVPDLLRVVPVPACGWCDLGTPARVEQALRRRRLERAHALLSPLLSTRVPLDIAVMLERRAG
jgi:mannose-1-phosphate guanylyltransferase